MKSLSDKWYYLAMPAVFFIIGYNFYFPVLSLTRSCAVINIANVSFLIYAKMINGAFLAALSLFSVYFMRRKIFPVKDIFIQHILNLALLVITSLLVKKIISSHCIITDDFYEPGVPLAMAISTLITLFACVMIKKCKS